METDNLNNSLIEIRHKERMLRSSKSRSMTPVIRSTSNNEDSSTVKSEISSARLSTGRKVVTSSMKSVSKTKTIGGKSSVTVVVETSSSQENSKTLPSIIDEVSPGDETLARLSAANVDIMELRSERQKISARQTAANITERQKMASRQSSANSTEQHKIAPRQSVVNSSRSASNGTGGDETRTRTRTGSQRGGSQRGGSTVRMRTSDYSSDDEDPEDGILQTRDAQSQRVLNAYRGDYWNKFPKTDFTYSPVSKDHFKEVAPGVSVKPNMSRGTYQHPMSASATYYATSPARETTRTTTTETTTATTSRRSRFFDAGKAGTRVPAYINDYAALDSDEDEVDARVRSEVTASRAPSFLAYCVSYFTAFWMVVTTTWTTTVERITGALTRDQGVSARYVTPPSRGMETHRGWWARTLDAVYFLPAYISAIDLGLLSSSAGHQVDGERPKRLRLFSGLMLLLLLLLGGWWLLYCLGLEDATTNSSALLGDAWAGTLAGWTETLAGWAGTLAGWFRAFGGWILLPFAAKQMRQEEWTLAKDYAAIPPATLATTPLGSTPPPLPAVDTLVDAVLASDRLYQLLRGGDTVGEVLTSPRFHEWISSRVDIEALALQVVASRQLRGATDVDSLAAGVWETGRLQAQLDERLAGSAENLRRELDQKSESLEVHHAKLAGEIARLKEEIEVKLNASVTEMKEKLREQLIHNEELKRVHEEEIRLLKVQMERCCDKTPAAIPWQDVESYVLRYVAAIYGVANPEKVDHAELRALLGNMFVGRGQFEAALANVTAHHRAEMREVSEQSAQGVLEAISDRVSEEFASHQRRLHVVGAGAGGLTDAGVMEIVNRAIMTYDADKTGMVDYALESSGGSVISTRCTESYYKHSASMTLFGIPYWYPVNTPRTVIQPGVHPGECWAFRGSQGFLVVQLAGLVRISSFSVEHIPRSLAFNGNIDSAPRDFSVWGLETENDLEPTELGKYTYLKNSTSLQYFLVARTDVQPFKIIELRIDSNHGNLEYTCLYRFRVHGTWVSY